MTTKRRRCACSSKETKVCPAYRALREGQIVTEYHDGRTLDAIASRHGLAGRGSVLYTIRKHTPLRGHRREKSL
jgi:hypothetical protein